MRALLAFSLMLMIASAEASDRRAVGDDGWPRIAERQERRALPKLTTQCVGDEGIPVPCTDDGGGGSCELSGCYNPCKSSKVCSTNGCASSSYYRCKTSTKPNIPCESC